MKYLNIFLIIILVSCNRNSDLKKIQLHFAPSFHHQTKYTIDINNKTVEQYVFQESFYEKEWIDSISYKTKRKDTLLIHYTKTFEINKKDLRIFLDKINDIKLDSTITHNEPILDGIGFRITEISKNNDTISLTSNLTRRNESSKIEYDYLDPFFNLLNRNINDYEGLVITENVQDYFSYSLPLKKTNEKPIEYRVWGTISGCRDDNLELLNLLKSLPDNEPILFDLRNGSIAYCLNEVLEEFSLKKDIYIYGDKSALESKAIMDEIKQAEKKGEELSRLRIQAYELHKEIYYNWIDNKKIKSFLTKDEVLKTIANTI